MVITLMFTSTSRDRVLREREIMFSQRSCNFVWFLKIFCVDFFDGSLCVAREIQLPLENRCLLLISVNLSVFYLELKKKLYLNVTGAYFSK